MLRYLQDAYEELKKVQWPTKKQTTRLTFYVIGVSLSVGLLVSGMDFLFSKGLGQLLTAEQRTQDVKESTETVATE